MKFTNRLRVARAERDVTQFELARRIGGSLNQSRLSLIERGYIQPTPEEMVAIAGELDMPVSDVFPQPQEASQ